MAKLGTVQSEIPSVTSSYLVRNAWELDANILHMLKTPTLKLLALVDSKKEQSLTKAYLGRLLLDHFLTVRLHIIVRENASYCIFMKS